MDTLEKLLGNKRLAEYYRSLGRPANIKSLYQFKEKVTGKPYSKNSMVVMSSKVRTNGCINLEGDFTPEFHEKLKEATSTKEAVNNRIQTYIEDVEIKDEIEIDIEISMNDVYKMLGRNTDLAFNIPKDMQPVDEIDFNSDKIQLVKLNNLSHYVRYPQYVKYVHLCPRCGTEYAYTDLTKVKCKECKIAAKINYNLSECRSAYIYVLDYNNEQYVARSLVELPLGDFSAALLIVRDLKSYSLYILATEKPKRPKIELKFKKGDRLKQLTNIIDDIHLRHVGKQIYGMTYYKYSILLGYLASMAGMTNYNIQIVGGGGLGKTSTPRLYVATISQKSKVQDAHNVTKAGVRGSTKQVSIEQFTYTVHEPGLLERNNIVVLDELLDATNEEVMYLKSVLGANTITIEVASNRAEIKKNAIVLATGNVPRWVKEKRNKHLLADEDPQVEFAIQNQWHLDGQNFNLLDRYALIFYVQSSDRQPDFNTNDQQLSDIELRQKVYAPEIDVYLKECAKIKPFMPENIKRELMKLSKQMYNPIHSVSRKDLYISMTCQLHAMVNGKEVIDMDDVKFTKNMYSKCFSEIPTSALDYDMGDDIKEFDVWALKTVLVKLGLSSRNNIRVTASKDYDTHNFDEVFETALHYGEIIKVAPDRYRCVGWID